VTDKRRERQRRVMCEIARDHAVSRRVLELMAPRVSPIRQVAPEVRQLIDAARAEREGA
jgi:hypothetical protein